VFEKLLGTFTERGTDARLLRLERSANFAVAGRRLLFVLHGEGRVAGDHYRPYTTKLCERTEDVTLAATAPTVILAIGLPRLDVAVTQAAAAE
jgi:hypothetical protein